MVRSVTDHTDIAPLLRRVLGLSHTSAPGHPYVAATSLSGYAEPTPNQPSGFEAALVEDSWKPRLRQMRDGPVVPHLHDLLADPGEINDLATSQPNRVAAMSWIVAPKLLSLWQRPQTDQIPSSAGEVARPK